MRIAFIIAAATVSLAVALAAHADPLPCAQFGVCQYEPHPSDNGPLLPTWDTPGTYGGWTTLPELCGPISYRCTQVAAP
jgi:hypothetical protein